MTKKLLIIGAGGLGRCCFDIARRMNCFTTIHFLDDKSKDENVVGTIKDLYLLKDKYDVVIVAIGNNHIRQQLIRKCEEMKVNISSLIDPMAFVSKDSIIEAGVIIFPFASIEANAIVKKGSIIHENTIIHHDTLIDQYVLVYGNCAIRPNTYIQPYETIESLRMVDRKNMGERYINV